MNNQEKIDLVKQIAFFLNAGEHSEVWVIRLVEDYPGVYLHKKNDPMFELYFRADDYGIKGRIEVHGNFHIGRGTGNSFVDVREYLPGDGRTTLPSITVAISRGAEAIAKEIKRRFLPEYTDLYNKAVAKRDSQIAYEDKVFQNLSRLAAIVSKPITENATHSSERRTSFDYYRNNGPYADVSCSADTATLKIHNLSIDMAESILRMIETR